MFSNKKFLCRKAFYAALLNGDTCLCSLYDFKILADPRNVTLNCDVKCSGGQVDTCGGQKDIKVYKLKSCYESKPSYNNMLKKLLINLYFSGFFPKGFNGFYR